MSIHAVGAKTRANWPGPILRLLPILIVSPFLLFPRRGLIWIALAVPFTWCLNIRGKGHFVAPTPLNGPSLALLTMVLVSLYATFSIDFSLPKVAGVILGIYVFFAIVQLVDRRGKLAFGVGTFCASGVILALVSLVGTQWKGRLAGVAALAKLLPARFKGLPGAEEGFHANAVGGSAILFIPLVSLVIYYALKEKPQGVGGKKLLRSVVAISLLAVFLLCFVLLLSESRGAWFSLILAMAFLLLLNLRWLRWIAICALVAGIAGVFIFHPWHFLWQTALSDQVTSAELSFASRMEVWSRALYGIQDFPFTGMGMNAFRKVMPVLYPAFTLAPDFDVASAHNHVLQAALDLGIPGMVAYLAIWAATARMLYYVVRRSADSFKRIVAQGIGAGLLAQFVFQLTDAIPLGAKVGIFFWMALGLSAALFRLVKEEVKATDEGVARVWKISTWEVFAIWVFSSLLSIAFIGEHPYVGLAIGIVGGIVLGYCAVENYLGKDESHGFTRMNADRVGVPESAG